MHVPQGVLDYQDIAVFEIRIVHISKFAQQTIGRRQVHEIFVEDGASVDDAGLLSEV
jgi:hypothetical protein